MTCSLKAEHRVWGLARRLMGAEEQFFARLAVP